MSALGRKRALDLGVAWAQRAIALVMVVWIAWYFSTYLPGFSS